MSADHVSRLGGQNGGQMVAGSWLAGRLAATAGQGRYPVEPLLTALGLAPDDITALATRLGIDRGWVQRCKRIGLGEVQADEWACRVGFHPMSIWADWGHRGHLDEDELDDLEEPA